MVYRVVTVRNGTEDHDAIPYQRVDDALTYIKDQWRRGLADSARIEDANYNRILWPDIRKRLDI